MTTEEVWVKLEVTLGPVVFQLQTQKSIKTRWGEAAVTQDQL